jgi:hypothetical protein
MADFAEWVVAAEPALPWPPGRFMEAYTRNRDEAATSAIEASPIGFPLLKHMDGKVVWEGTPAQLLAELEMLVDERRLRQRDWPGTPRGLRAALTRVAPSLRQIGINVALAPGLGANDYGRDRCFLLRVNAGERWWQALPRRLAGVLAAALAARAA